MLLLLGARVRAGAQRSLGRPARRQRLPTAAATARLPTAAAAARAHASTSIDRSPATYIVLATQFPMFVCLFVGRVFLVFALYFFPLG